MSAGSRKEREERAFDALLVSILRRVDKDDDIVEPDMLPQLTDEEKAAMNELGPDFIDRIVAGERPVPPSEKPKAIEPGSSRIASEHHSDFAQKNRAFLAEKYSGSMTVPTDAVTRALEEYRAYLETLKNIQIDPRVRQKFGMSDIVQITLLEAGRDLERIQGMDAAGRKRWLRRMLMNNVLDELRKFLNRPAEVSLEPLRAAAEQSSCRVQNWLAVQDTSPSEKLIREEEQERLLEALARINPRQREALILQKYHGWKLDQIAEHMGCTSAAVAGLHARGLKELRKLLPDLE